VIGSTRAYFDPGLRHVKGSKEVTEMTGSVLFASCDKKQTPLGLRHRWSLVDSASEPQPIGASRLGIFALFAGLDTEAIAEIAASSKEKCFKAGARVIHQGQVGKEIFLLEEGSVGIYSEKGEVTQLIAVLENPSVFGEMAVVNRERVRTASVEAITDLKLLAIPIDDLLGFLKRFAALRTNLRWMIAARTPRQ
jgi:cyclic nucleotide-binding protein